MIAVQIGHPDAIAQCDDLPVQGRPLKRVHIEESFRDEKTGRFDLEATHLTDPKPLDTLPAIEVPSSGFMRSSSKSSVNILHVLL